MALAESTAWRLGRVLMAWNQYGTSKFTLLRASSSLLALINLLVSGKYHRAQR